MAHIIKIQDLLNLNYFRNQATPMSLEKFLGKNIVIYDIQKGHNSKYDKIQYKFKIKCHDGIFSVKTMAKVVCNQLTEALLKMEQLGYDDKSFIVCKLAKENNNMILLESEPKESTSNDVSAIIQTN